MKTLLVSLLLLSLGSLSSFSAPTFASGNYSGFEPWWFMGGEDEHVVASAVDGGIQNLIDGDDTCPGESWRYGSNIPNSRSVPVASYITNSFTIEGNHEIEFVFSSNCVNEDGTLNYKSTNNKYDIDIYVYNSTNNQQLASLRIWFDSGGFTLGNHSYELGVGDNFPTQWSGSNWINGNAMLSSSFLINFSKEHLFRSYVNKWDDMVLRRLDNTTNAFYNAAQEYFDGVDNIYFRIKGDGGFAKQATIILRSINGQSLAASAGTIIDNKAPDIYEVTPLPNTIEANTEYEIPVKAVDVLSNPTVKYYFDNVELPSNKITPTALGDHVIKVEATDAHENVAVKEYNINVTGALTPPVITGLPTIEDQSLKTGQYFRCGAPTYEDVTGTGTVSAVLKRASDDHIINLDYDSVDNEFSTLIDDDFQSGAYSVIFTVTNSVGSVISDPINFNIDVTIVLKPDFVTYEDGISVKYVDEGLLVHSIGGWRKTSFGVFDIRYGIDAYVTIPILSSNGDPNTASYFDLNIVNVDNENYWIMYRIWLDERFLTNDSSPTNMYINYGTPGNSKCIDISDCGWLTRTVGGVDGRFHLNYDLNNGFSGEFRNALQPAMGTPALVTKFFDEAETHNFYVKFYAASRGDYMTGQNTEFIINELNGQNLANENGVIDVIARPTIVIGSIDQVYKANSTSYVNVYVKDILNINPTYNVRFMDLEGNIISEQQFTNGHVPLNIPDPGEYKVKIFTLNKRNKEIGKTFEIEARSSTDPVSVSVNNPYEASYLPGDTITISDATYSANVELSKTKITLLREKDEREVHPGDSIKLEKAGMYIVDYYACDNAYPHPNEIHQKSYINVYDTVKPVVDIFITGSLRAEEEVNISVSITDDTECDTAIIITDTNGYKTTFFDKETSFIPEEKGEYIVTVRVEDSYNNITIETRTIKVKGKAFNKTLASWIAIGVIFASLLGGFIALTTIMKVRAKKGEIH